MAKRMERAAASIGAAAKSVKATVRGLKGVFRTLMKQHGEATELLHQLQMTSDPDTCDELWTKLRGELISHERGELREVYPALRQHAKTRAIADLHEAEAGELERHIETIDATDPDSHDWKRLLGQLGDMVGHHVDEEEGKWFPAAQEVLGEEETERLDELFQTAKKEELDDLENPADVE